METYTSAVKLDVSTLGLVFLALLQCLASFLSHGAFSLNQQLSVLLGGVY